MLRGTNQKQSEIEKQVNENLEKQLKLRIEILNVSSGLLYRIGETIGLQDRELSQLGNMLDAFTQFASGNIAGAIGSLVSTVIESFPSAAEKYNNEIERLNKLLEQQTRLIEESERKGGQQTELEKKVDILLKKEENVLLTVECRAGLNTDVYVVPLICHPVNTLAASLTSFSVYCEPGPLPNVNNSINSLA